jgi:hypothetical protein
MRLVKVELTRLLSRRAVVIHMVLGALVVGAVVAGVLYDARPVSDAEQAAAVAETERYNSEPWMVRNVERCERRGTATEICEQRFHLEPDEFLYRAQLDVADGFEDWTLAMTGVLAALALLIGSTFVGADYSSGSIGTQLVFQPGRSKMWSAKTAGLAIGLTGYAALILLAANGTLYATARAWDRPIPDGVVSDWTAASARGLFLVVAAGIGGYAIALLARHTAAALGLIAAYGVAGEAVARAISPGSERWLLSNHLIAWVGGDWKLERWDTCLGADCKPEIIPFTTLGAGTYLGLIALAAALASFAVFRRRDVA